MSSSPISAQLAKLHEQWALYAHSAFNAHRRPREVNLAKLLDAAWPDQLMKAS